jgi:hypothetical protein
MGYSMCCISSYWFIIFGLFHAIWVNIFIYLLFVENTELHIGPSKIVFIVVANSWQDPEEKKKFKPIIPKLWYGWIGKGTKNGWQIASQFKRFVKNIKKLKVRYK